MSLHPPSPALMGGCVVLLLLAGCGRTVESRFVPEGRLDAFDESDWRLVLEIVATDDGFVRWDALAANEGGARDALERYVGQIAAASPDGRPDLFPARDDALAYYLNAYNALCMFGVLERGLPGNVLTSGIFFFDKFDVGGERRTLDDLERNTIRAFDDARIHFALNCMSASCPPLRAEPYAGQRLDEQLAEQGDIFLSDPRGVVDLGDGKVALNRIFGFWDDDFEADHRRLTGRRGDLLDAAKLYAAPDGPVRDATDFTLMNYDWSLNRPPR